MTINTSTNIIIMVIIIITTIIDVTNFQVLKRSIKAKIDLGLLLMALVYTPVVYNLVLAVTPTLVFDDDYDIGALGWNWVINLSVFVIHDVVS
jgi:hypothetical protein